MKNKKLKTAIPQADSHRLISFFFIYHDNYEDDASTESNYFKRARSAEKREKKDSATRLITILNGFSRKATCITKKESAHELKWP